METEHRLNLLTQEVVSACQMGAWCYGIDGQRYFCLCPHEQELELFLKMGDCLEIDPEELENPVPVIISDPIGFIWIREVFSLSDSGLKLISIWGPVFPSRTSNDVLMNRLREMDISLQLRSLYAKILMEIPVLNARMIDQYARMLHYAVKEERYSGEIRTKGSSLSFRTDEQEESSGTEPAAYRRQYAYEQSLLAAVREGNIHQGKEAYEKRGKGDLFSLDTDDPVREVKDNIIIFIARCCQAAIDGGLPVETAKKMEVSYIRQVEKLSRITDLSALNRHMFEDFTRRVHDWRSSPEISQPVKQCCDYIQKNFTKPVRMADIAEAVGYAEYYVSKKFAREMGIKIQDYLRDTRLNYSRMLLLTTDRTIEDISEYLQFGSRNYFDRVFRSAYGISPVQFRNRGGLPK